MASYDGNPKWWTKDCEDCPCRKEFNCYWGSYRKELVTVWPGGKIHKPKHCEYRNRPPVRDPRWWNIPEVREKETVTNKQGKLF